MSNTKINQIFNQKDWATLEAELEKTALTSKEYEALSNMLSMLKAPSDLLQKVQEQKQKLYQS